MVTRFKLLHAARMMCATVAHADITAFLRNTLTVALLVELHGGSLVLGRVTGLGQSGD